MNVTESRFKNRQLHIEDYLQMVSAEQEEYECGVLLFHTQDPEWCIKRLHELDKQVSVYDKMEIDKQNE